MKIDTDGDIASVLFDYDFLGDGRESTADGWKITSVICSVNLKPTPAQ